MEQLTFCLTADSRPGLRPRCGCRSFGAPQMRPGGNEESQNPHLAGATPQKRIPHLRSPRAGDRVRDDRLGVVMEAGSKNFV